MKRVRFKTQEHDCRPIKFPPPYPYWYSGMGDDYNILIAYVDDDSQIYEFWPEAYDLDSETVDKIVFSDRFSKPDWYNP